MERHELVAFLKANIDWFLEALESDYDIQTIKNYGFRAQDFITELIRQEQDILNAKAKQAFKQ